MSKPQSVGRRRYPSRLATKIYQLNVCSVIVIVLVTIVGWSEILLVDSISLTSSKDATSKTRDPITLEEAFLGELRAKDFDFDWIPVRGAGDNELRDQLVYEDSNKNILLEELPSLLERKNGTGGTSVPSGDSFRYSKVAGNFEPNTTVLVSNNSILASVEFQGFKLSPSRRYLLLWNSRRKQFRHSSTAKYFLYDIKLDLITLLSTKQSQSNSQPIFVTDTSPLNEENEYIRFQVVDWYSNESPAGLIDSLVMIQGNDIYKLYDVSRLSSSTPTNYRRKRHAAPISHDALPVRLTYTGSEGVLFNGVPDWLYEEEILGDTPAFQVSPSSNYLAYMTFDDSHVNIMPYTFYGDRIIPRIQLIRYPKAGQPNPVVSVHVVDDFNQVSNDRPTKFPAGTRVNLPGGFGAEQHYIHRINWLTNEQLALIWSSRNQNSAVVMVCSRDPSSTWNCVENLNMKAENGWLDIGDDLMPLNDDYYLALVPKYESQEGGYFKHVAKVSLKKPNTVKYLTSGPKEVLSLNGVDYKRSLVYYTSTAPHQPGQRHLYVAELDASPAQSGAKSDILDSTPYSECITCENYPDACLYNYAKVSPSTNYYMFHCMGPSVPRVELRAARRRQRNLFENLVNDTRQQKFFGRPNAPLSSQNGTAPLDIQSSPSLLLTFEENKRLRDKLENQKSLPVTLRAKVPITGTEYLADVLLLIPPNLLDLTYTGANKLKVSGSEYLSLDQIRQLLPNTASGSGQRLPMVVDVYGGPGSQKVDFRFNVNFGHYLASSKQIVYAMIDGRGSGFQGSKRLFELYHKLGTVEIQDQINVADQLAQSLWFIDPARVAIWGWSYGGYAAAMSLAQSKLRSSSNGSSDAPKPAHNQSNSDFLPRSVFKCAASVAPVTNWIYYDTAYTEKFMSSPWINEKYDNLYPGDHLNSNEIKSSPAFSHSSIPYRDPLVVNKWTPLNRTLSSLHIQPHTIQHLFEAIVAPAEAQKRRSSPPSNPKQLDNKLIDLNDRYRRASLLDLASNLKSNSYLLVHGTADDNVNFQQSIMLMKRLIKTNTLFETRLYPDQDHGIAEKADKLHLGSTLSNFLIGCLG